MSNDPDDLLYKLEHDGRGMKLGHYVGILVILAIGYYVGSTYPKFWTKVTG